LLPPGSRPRNMIDRLAEDHANARRLGAILEALGFHLVFDKVSTNMGLRGHPRTRIARDAGPSTPGGGRPARERDAE
jgi:hypothetical protein